MKMPGSRPGKTIEENSRGELNLDHSKESISKAAAAESNTAGDQVQLFLASPRGFCAGVERAIRTVERALELYGKPIYVRHEIVHNHHVVEQLRALGVVFVEELEEIPEDSWFYRMLKRRLFFGMGGYG